MKKTISKLFKGFVFFVIVFFPLKGYAAELPSGVVIGDETGLRVQKDGIYFIEKKGITPGQHFSRQISIGNYSQQQDKVHLQMMINPDDKDHKPIIKGAENLFNVIDLKLTLDEKVIYDGSISGVGKNIERNKPIDLGNYRIGDTKSLKADFKVKTNVDLSKWREESSVEFYFVFYANRNEEPEKEKPKDPETNGKLPPGLAGLLPQTDEELSALLLGIAIGFILIMLGLRMFIHKDKAN